MRVDVAGRSFRVTSLASGHSGRFSPVVDHDRYIRQRARFDTTLHRRPFRTGEVRRLDAHNHAGISLSSFRSWLRRHVGEILLELAAAHPLPTMLRKAKTRVLDRSMTRCLKSSKFRQPAPPASS